MDLKKRIEKLLVRHSLFCVGQVVRHKIRGYSGVIFDVDPVFMGTDEWYQKSAVTCPPKDRPWYRVLVHEEDYETYVAECNVEECRSHEIEHPLVKRFFAGFDGVSYVSRQPVV